MSKSVLALAIVFAVLAVGCNQSTPPTNPDATQTTSTTGPSAMTPDGKKGPTAVVGNHKINPNGTMPDAGTATKGK